MLEIMKKNKEKLEQMKVQKFNPNLQNRIKAKNKKQKLIMNCLS